MRARDKRAVASRLATVVIVDTVCVCVVGAAWRLGLLDSFLGTGSDETHLLLVLAALFIAGQAAVAMGCFQAADRIAQLLPKAGLVAFGLALLALAARCNLGTAAGDALFRHGVIQAVGINVFAVAAHTWIDELVSLTAGDDRDA